MTNPPCEQCDFIGPEFPTMPALVPRRCERMTITEFLLARIAEDEAAALGVEEETPLAGWVVRDDRYEGIGLYCSPDIGEQSGTTRHMERHGPARVLAECAAKRRIVAMAPWCNNATTGGAFVELPGDFILKTLASAYADHPDFDGKWRP